MGTIAVGALGVSVLAQVQQMMNAEAASGPQAGWLKVEIPRDGDPLHEQSAAHGPVFGTRLLPEDAAAIERAVPTRGLRPGRRRLRGGGGPQGGARSGEGGRAGHRSHDPGAVGGEVGLDLVGIGKAVHVRGGRARCPRCHHRTRQLKGTLSGSSPLLGAQMHVGGVSYRVVGILLPGADHYDSPYVLIPTGSARGALTPTTWEIFVHAKPADLPQPRQQVDAVLKVRLGDPHKSFTESASGVFSTLDRKGLAFLGMIALLVLLSSRPSRSPTRCTWT